MPGSTKNIDLEVFISTSFWLAFSTWKLGNIPFLAVFNLLLILDIYYWFFLPENNSWFWTKNQWKMSKINKKVENGKEYFNQPFSSLHWLNSQFLYALSVQWSYKVLFSQVSVISKFLNLMFLNWKKMKITIIFRCYLNRYYSMILSRCYYKLSIFSDYRKEIVYKLWYYLLNWPKLFDCTYPDEKCFCSECSRAKGERTLDEFNKITIPDYSKLLTPTIWLKLFTEESKTK